MTSRTRYFLFASVAVLSLGLCTGLVAYYNGALPFSAPVAGRSELAYLPADSTAVAYANVAEVMKSEFRKRIQQALPTGEDKQKLLEETGIDLEHDIESVVAGFTGDDPAQGGAIVLIRGRFDATKVESMCTAHGATIEVYKGKRLLLGGEMPKAREGVASMGSGSHFEVLHNAGGLAFLDSNLLVIGDSGAIKRAIDAAASGENVTKNDQLMKLVDDLRTGNNAWVVGRSDALSNHAGLPDLAKQQLKTVQWFAVSAHVNAGVSGVVRAEAVDEKAADDLRAVVNGALAAARMFGGDQNKGLQAAINSMQMSGKGKTIALSFKVSPEVLDMLNGVAGLSNLTHTPTLVKPKVIKK